ncbi:hypothetical protein [Streptosporangium sp. NPDC002607]
MFRKLPPGPFKPLAGVLLLSVAILGLKWMSGADPYVRGPFFWAALVTAVLSMALALAVAVKSFRRARRHEYDEREPEEAPDEPRNRLLMFSAAMLLVMATELSLILSLLAATDGGAPHTTGPLDWALWASQGLLFVLIVGVITWGARRGVQW